MGWTGRQEILSQSEVPLLSLDSSCLAEFLLRSVPRMLLRLHSLDLLSQMSDLFGSPRQDLCFVTVAAGIVVSMLSKVLLCAADQFFDQQVRETLSLAVLSLWRRHESVKRFLQPPCGDRGCDTFELKRKHGTGVP